MKSTGALSSNELQWFDLKIGHQDSSLRNGHQGDMPHCINNRWMTDKGVQWDNNAVNPIKYGHGFITSALFCCGYIVSHDVSLPIFFRVASLALGQLHNWIGACKVTLKDMGKSNWYRTTTLTTKCRPYAWFLGCAVHISRTQTPSLLNVY